MAGVGQNGADVKKGWEGVWREEEEGREWEGARKGWGIRKAVSVEGEGRWDLT